MQVSVILCTWNNSARLATTLAALRGCCLPPGLTWELILTNSGSTDDTRAVARCFTGVLPLVYVEEPRPGLSRAKNAGLRMAQGRLLIFMDDDVTPFPGWIAAYCAAYAERPSGYYFGGPLVSEYEGRPDAALLHVAGHSITGLDWGPKARRLGDGERVYPANWACPAPAIGAVGGFDPDLGLDASLGSRRVGETFDVMDRLSAIGMAAWYLPDARVRHFVPRHKCTLRSVGQNAEAIGRYSARAARPHPFVLRRPELRAWGVKPSGPLAGVPWLLSIRTATLGIRWIAARLGGHPAYAEYVALRFCLGRMKELRAARRAVRFEQAGHPRGSSASRAATIPHPSDPPPIARREGRACALAFRLGWAFGIRGLRHPSSLYCFFSFSRVGGAERVHTHIVQCLAERRPWVVLTGRSRDRRLRRAFARHARVVSVGWWERHALTRATLVGYLTALVNRHPEAIVFGAKSRLFYDLLPGLDPHVRAVDLIHAFGGRTPLEVVSLSVVRRLDCRVTVTRRTRADFEQQYHAQGVERHYAERIRVVTNRVDVPATRPIKPRTGPLTVLYVGRASEEKRAHLAAQVARRCREAALPCEFVFVGDVRPVVTPEKYPECDVRGWLAEPAELAAIYERAHVLLLPSSREGFPLVLMEAMANGVVPIATTVGGIREHLRDGVTGWLIEAESEADVVRAMTHAVERLLDRLLLDQMSAAAYEYARGHFTGVDFCRAYREILGPRGATP